MNVAYIRCFRGLVSQLEDRWEGQRSSYGRRQVCGHGFCCVFPWTSRFLGGQAAIEAELTDASTPTLTSILRIKQLWDVDRHKKFQSLFEVRSLSVSPHKDCFHHKIQLATVREMHSYHHVCDYWNSYLWEWLVQLTQLNAFFEEETESQVVPMATMVNVMFM